MKRFTYAILLLFISLAAYAQEYIPVYEKTTLTYQMSEEELARRDEIGRGFIKTDPPTGNTTHIAEFQPMQGVMIRYPLGIPLTLVKEMSEIVKVTTIVANTATQNSAVTAFTNAGVNMDNVEFLTAATDSYWTRDYGPWFIIDGNDEFGIVDYPYNRPRPNDNNIASVSAPFYDVNLFGMNMIHTGGNYMTDGYGTSASTTLVKTENPSLSLAQLNQMAKDYLGVDLYHLIEDPLGEYIEHIDCWGKYLGVDKVLVAKVAETDSRYETYEAIAEWFSNTTTSWGNRYRVYRVYAPGNNTVTPYTNSLILNNHVFVPQAGSQWDAGAIASYEEAMPGYTIVPVMQASATPWLNTDALHCRTKEIADLKMLLINHYPLLGAKAVRESYDICADITAYSGEAFVADSVLIYYSINNAEWQTAKMQHISGRRWQGAITGTKQGDEIAYYIFAKDNSGRREQHPYIGRHDPHIFTATESSTPEIAIDTEQFDLTAFNTETRTFSFSIKNTGNDNLNYQISVPEATKGLSSESIFTFSPQSGLITPNYSEEITATVHSTDLKSGLYEKVVSVKSNATHDPDMQIPATLRVYNGLIIPDTIWITSVNNPTVFSVSSDYPEGVTVTSIEVGDIPFEGTVKPYGPSTLPLLIPASSSIDFEAEFTGTSKAPLYFDGTFKTDLMSRTITIAYIPHVDISEVRQENFLQVYPNPASQSVQFTYISEGVTSATVSIFDITGRLIKTLHNSDNTPGQKTIHWNLTDSGNLPSGVYLYHIRTEKNQSTGKILIIK